MTATHKLQINTEEQCDQKMVITNERITKGNIHSFLLVKQSGRWQGAAHVAMANRRENVSANSIPKRKPSFPLKISSKLLAQSAVAVLGLGFIDAGYSGDWSRIGVISKESEELLKVAAFFVVPLCLLFIVSLSERDEQLNS